MKTDLFSVFEIACMGAIALVGCSSDSRTPSGAAGPSPTTTTETGMPAPGVDAGCPAANAGCPATDAGCPGKEAGCPAPTPDDAQTPPTGEEAAMSAWLAKGDYKTWKCESASHDPRPNSPHPKNRICSNNALSTHGAGEYPVGAAGVKELYDDAGANVIGHAVFRKVARGKGEAWFWFEKTQADGLVVNGLGDSGIAKTVCVGCHSAAGSDASHTGHDFVYTQVK